ncbi:MAG: hypothetical protein AAFX02_06415, partial [Pseudomonadota bacterium]
MFRKKRKAIIYAIGDVHGEADRLRQLHHYILDRHELTYLDRHNLVNDPGTIRAAVNIIAEMDEFDVMIGISEFVPVQNVMMQLAQAIGFA